MIDSHNRFSNISPADYEQVAVLARLVGEEMIARLDLVNLQPKIIIDVGSGTGRDAVLLGERYPEAQIVAIDNVKNMSAFNRAVNSVLANAGSLPFQDHSVDLVFANLLLPWCNDWNALFQEWRRVLRPEGLLLFSCFGPDTLKELGAHSLVLKDMHDIGDTLVQTRFSDPVMDVEHVVMKYNDREKMLYELQITGIEMKSSEISSLSLTYEIVYGHVWGPDFTVGNTADEEGVVRIPLSQLRLAKMTNA